MPAVGEAVAEHADFFGLLHQRGVDCFGNHYGADRQVAGGKRLGAGDHIGLQAVGGGSPHLAGTAETRKSLRRQ